MMAEAGRPDVDPGVEEEPVLYVVDDGPDGPEELLRLAPTGDPESTEPDPDDAETGNQTDETNDTFGALPH